MKHLIKLLHHHRFRLLIVVFGFLAVTLGLLIVPVESASASANILTIEDGIWWAVTTMTGVGFGDVYPVTTWGRGIGIVLEVLGVVVFGLIAGHIAVTLFRIQDDFYWRRLFHRLNAIETRLTHLEKQQEYLIKTNGQNSFSPSIESKPPPDSS